MDMRWGLLAASALVLVSFLSLIFIVFGFSGLSFLLSLILLITLMALLALTMGGIAKAKAWGWSFLSFISLVLIFYAYIVYLIFGLVENLGILIVSSVIMLVVSVLNFRLADQPEKESIEAPPSPKVEVYESLDKVEPTQQKGRDVKVQVNVNAAGAKVVAPRVAVMAKQKLPFVASKMASAYHRSNCEWVNNIKRRNKVWFSTEKQAKKAGFKPHECIAESK